MSEGATRPAADAVDGIHHVSAVVGDPHGNRRFYADVLGLRPVKRTVNFDEPHVYHLYYGDAAGTPGATVTAFPYPLDPGGRVGTGQPVEASLAVPEGSLPYWRDRLSDSDATVGDESERFGRATLAFADPDGTPLALTEVPDEDPAFDRFDPWGGADVSADRAVRGVHGVTLASANAFVTARLLEVLGFELVAQAGDRVRYVLGGGTATRPADDAGANPGTDATVDPGEAPTGTVVDLLDRDTEWGKEGAGTLHHVAFGVADEAELAAWRERLADAGVEPTRVRDRHYFSSVYVRDPGGVLFELATAGPGLAVDEPRARLGETLQVPPWLAADRDAIEAQLPSLEEPVARSLAAAGGPEGDR